MNGCIYNYHSNKHNKQLYTAGNYLIKCCSLLYTNSGLIKFLNIFH